MEIPTDHFRELILKECKISPKIINLLSVLVLSPDFSNTCWNLMQKYKKEKQFEVYIVMTIPPDLTFIYWQTSELMRFIMWSV